MDKEIHSKLSGVTKRNDAEDSIQEILENISDHFVEGWELLLEQEEDNPYDRNAIKVFLDGEHIGYISRDLAEELAPLVKQDRVKAELTEITGGYDGKSYGCNILIKILPEGVTARGFSDEPLKIYGPDYFQSLSDHDFSTWFAHFLKWKDELPPDADLRILDAVKRQRLVVHNETIRREKARKEHGPTTQLEPKNQPARDTLIESTGRNRLTCPKCGSTNINVQAIQRTKLTNKHHSLIWWLIIGWWWMLIKWLFFTLPALIVKIFAPKRQKLEQEIISVCVCQSCGYQWEVEQDDGHLSLFDRLVPVDSFREKALPFAAAILSFAVTMTVLILAFA